MNLRALILTLLLLHSFAGQTIWAQSEPMDWEIGRVYVPRENQAIHIPPSNYLVIELKELDSQLEKLGSGYRSNQVNPITIDSAMYVATINRDLLVSDGSYWRLKGSSANNSFSIGKISFALRDAKGIPEDYRQLSQDHRFASDGSIEVDLATTNNLKWWFGFQAAATVKDNTRTFQIQVPKAGMAKMLISADSGVKISSKDVVVTQVATLNEHLPADWPTSLVPRPSPRQAWWLIYLSGASQFTINASESSDALSPSYVHALASADISHQVVADSLITAATFKFATESNGQPVALALSRSSKIRSVSVDGRLVGWRILDANQERFVAQLITSDIEAGTVIEVQAVSSFKVPNAAAESSQPIDPPDRQVITIPAIELAKASVLSGTTSIRSDGATSIMRIDSEQKFRRSALDPTLSNSLQNWQATWNGWPAPARAIIRPTQESWTTSSLCSIKVQDSSVLANLSLNLSGTGLRSNQLRLPVLAGWTIDSVVLPKELASNLRAFPVNEDGKEEILVTWQGQREQLNTQLEIVASTPIEPSVDSFAIQNPRVVQVPDPHDVAYWVLQSSSSYRLRNNIDRLPIAIDKSDLVAWQQQLLSDDNSQVYRDLSDGNGRFIFDSAPGSVIANILTVAERPEGNRLKVETQIDCQPKAGTVDRVILALPPGPSMADWKFTFASGNQTAVPVSVIPIDNQPRESIGMDVELRLPISANTPFQLQATLELDIPNGAVEAMQLPILGLPAANSVNSVLVLPSHLAHFSEQPTVELLASTDCCSEEILQLLQKRSGRIGLNAQTQENWVSAQIDGNEAQLIKLNASSTNSRSSWIWNESLIHDLTETGYCRHMLEMDIQNGSSNTFAFNLPLDWQVDRITVDGIEQLDFFRQSDEMEIELQANSRSQISVHFHSNQPVLKWLNGIAFASPNYQVPVLQRSEQLQLPQTYLAMIAPDSTSKQDLVNRLRPLAWWSAFSPGSSLGSTSASSDPQERSFRPLYNLTNFQRAPHSAIWIGNRNSLATLLLVLLSVCVFLNWLLIHRSVRLWGAINVSLLVLVVLLPETVVLPAQILLLAAMLAVLVRLIEVVARRQTTIVRLFPQQGPRVVASLLIAGYVSQAYGQAIDESTVEKSSKIYAVVIPYEGDIEDPQGQYAYIPKELQDLLSSSNSTITSKQAPPKIVGASYILKMRQNPRDAAPVQELSVELKIVATDAFSELAIPLPESLKLTNSKLNGQTKLPGVRYFDVTTDAILFRPDSVGSMTVELTFQPTAEDLGDQKFQLNSTIPPIPNATLRIVPNSQTSGLTINARGGLQRMTSGDYLAQLGSIDELQVEWAENDRSSSTIATEYTTESWVRSHADGVSVACQLTIERGRSLQEEFELFIDSDWEPVGTKWGSAELVSSVISTPLKRRVVRIRLSETAGTTCRVPMLLVHQPNTRTSTIDVPFISLDRVALKSKLFWWSADPAFSWAPEGLELMPKRVVVSDWGDLSIAPERTGYQVVGNGVRLRQQTAINTNASLVELNTLHLFVTQTELEYDATWERSSAVYEDLLVSIPEGCELKRLEVNGKLSTAVSRQPRMLRIPMAGTTNARIKIVLELPPIQGEVQQIPRVQLNGLQARQSNYQIFRGTGLEVQLLPTNSGLVFTNASAANRRSSFDRLETQVGEANLPPEMLNEESLAARLRVEQRATVPHRSLVQYLERTNNGWIATVRCTWDSNATGLDYSFFDVPIQLRDNIETDSQVCIFKPHSDPLRINLCIPIPATENERPRTVEFSYAVPVTASSYSITLPRITANHGLVTSPVVALPKVVDGQEVRWVRAGRLVEDSWFESAGLKPLPEYEYISLLPNQSKLIWQSSQLGDQTAHVELIWLEVSSSSSEKMAGIVNYWIAPNSQVSQRFEIPEGCEILGVDYGDRRTAWSVEDKSLRVTLQPNSVPLSVRIMAQWKLDPRQKNSLVNIPKPLMATEPNQVFLSMPDDLKWSVVNSKQVTSINSDTAVDHWAAIVMRATESLSSMPDRQSANWLAAWYPEHFRIRRDILVDLPALQTQLSAFDSNDDNEVSVAEIWERSELLARNTTNTLDDANSNTVRGDFSAIRWRIQGSEIPLVQRTSLVQYNSTNWLTAGGLAAIGMLALVLGSRIRNWVLPLLATQPWIYWTLLSLLMWISLPISWPSWIVLVVSFWMATTQWIDNRRRTRRFGFN